MFSHENAYFLISAFSSTTLKRLKTLVGTKVHYAFSDQRFLKNSPLSKPSLSSALGTLRIDNEMHDDDLRNPRRIGSRVSFLLF